MRILLIEDEKPLSAAICKLLTQEHFAVDPVYNGIDGLDYAEGAEYDAIILDVMLPGMDGFSLLQKLRADGYSTPVLMLTARGDLDDRIRGLNSGADYYLPKPFETAELVACIRTITRRKSDKPILSLKYGNTELSEKDASLHCAQTGSSVKLSAKEYQLMELFLRNPKQILTRETILDRVWGMDSDAEYNSLEVYVSFLRKKLSFIGSDLRIRASRGIGYAMEVEQT